MKTLLTILLLLLSINIIAQEDFDLVVSLGSDVKMMTEGPYKDQPNDIGTSLDFEIRVYLDYENYRMGTTFQSHQAIHFYKWAVGYDFKFNDFPISNFVTSVGPEFGLIKRTHRNNYIKTTHDWLQLGSNLDLNYRIPKSNMSFGFNYNVYRAEEELRDYGKKFRQDVTFYISLTLG